MIPVDAVRSTSLTTDDQRTLKINYFITSGICLTDGAKQITTFGIKAELSVGGKFAEMSKIDDVSPSEETVRIIIDLLAKNNVTPVSLKDVVEDCVAMQYNV